MHKLYASIVFVLVSLFTPLASFADEASQLKAQQTITNQLEAFKVGDDAKAYSYAAPRVTQFFPDVASFMAMVKNGYQPVYKPLNYNFGRTRELGGDQIAQELLVTGPDGKPWTALYTLVKMPNGDWLITAVQIAPGDDSSA
jgi:Domain of unknown function (DUF4864)